MRSKITSLLLLFFAKQTQAQIPLRGEPGHDPVFQNKYIRLPERNKHVSF